MIYKRTPVGLFLFVRVSEDLFLVADEHTSLRISAEDAEAMMDLLPGDYVAA